MEKEIIIYLIKSGVCMGVFMLIYHLFLRRSTFFRFNRIYLLAGLVFSFIIPSVQYSYDIYIPFEMSSILAANVHEATSVEQEASGVNVWQIIGYVYIGFVLLMLVRTSWSVRKLIKLICIQKYKLTEKYVLIDSEQIQSPFSVFNYILLNTKKLSPTEKELILRHEMSHIRQKHWIDLIVSQLVLIVQCFNPLAWKYVSLQKENHEFLADKAVIDDGISPTLYRSVLINQRFEGTVFSFSNSFNLSNPLNRLNMITSTKSSPWKKIAVLIIIPLMGIYIWGSARANYVFERPVDLMPVVDDSIRIYVETANGSISPSNSSTTVVTRMITIPDGTARVISDVRIAGKRNMLHTADTEVTMEMDSLKGKVNLHIKGFSYRDTTANSLISSSLSKISADKDISFTLKERSQDNHFPHSYLSSNKNEIRQSGMNSTSDIVWIIDGENGSMKDLEAINPTEIEHIYVLKDKNAVKQYGEKGKNGVIHIVTKKNSLEE